MVLEVGEVFVVIGDVKNVAVVGAFGCVTTLLLVGWCGVGNCASSCLSNAGGRPGCPGCCAGGACPFTMKVIQLLSSSSSTLFCGRCDRFVFVVIDLVVGLRLAVVVDVVVFVVELLVAVVVVVAFASILSACSTALTLTLLIASE